MVDHGAFERHEVDLSVQTYKDVLKKVRFFSYTEKLITVLFKSDNNN